MAYRPVLPRSNRHEPSTCELKHIALTGQHGEQSADSRARWTGEAQLNMQPAVIDLSLRKVIGCSLTNVRGLSARLPDPDQGRVFVPQACYRHVLR